ncbi:MAG: hypothetical protein K8T20_17255 [Planctomycetes bacterium]|nr:hypothetical protein [Planctomycetota bacterium]
MRQVIALMFLAVPFIAGADVLHMKNGATMDGRAVTEEGEEFAFKLSGGGQVQVKRADVDWIEWSSVESAKAEFDKRRKPATLAAFLDAGAWAKFHGMSDQAQDAFMAAIKLDPQNAAANEGLGRKKFADKWVTDDEYRKLTGHVKVGSRWVTADEKNRMDAGWEWVDGKLVSPDDAKRAKGLMEYEGKWVTKKEFDDLVKKNGPPKEKPAGDKPAGDKPGGGTTTEKPPDKPAEKPVGDPTKLHNDKEDAAISALFGKGFRLHSGYHYRLITNCVDKDPDFDKKFVDSMDLYWSHYLELFDKNPEQKKLHNILVLPSSKEYDEWLKKNAGGAGVGAFGTYLHGHPFQVATLWYRQVAGIDDNVRTTLFTGRHECCHQFVAFYVRGDGGPWFQEGIAALQEPDIPYYLYPYRWDFIRLQVLEGKNDISMADLLKKSASLDANQQYSRGAATHFFFLNYKDGLYKKKYIQFMCKGSIDSPDALAKAMGTTIEELEKQYREFIKEMDVRRDKEEPKWAPGTKPPGAGNAK